MVGTGDFAMTDGINCDINIQALRALSFVDLTVASICNFLIVKHILIRLLDRNVPFSAVYSQAKSMLPFFFLLHGIGDTTFCILKLHSQNIPLVGKDVMITIIAFICPMSMFCGLVLYYMVIINFLKSYSCMMSVESKEKVEQRFLKLLVSSYAIPIFLFVFAISPCIGISYPIYAKICARIYLIGMGFISGFYGALYGLAFCFLVREIEVHVFSSTDIGEDILLVLRRLKIAYYAGTSLFAMVMVSHLLCGCYDELTTKSSYVLLIIQILSQLVVTTLILTISRISNVNKGPQSFHTETSSVMHQRIDIKRLKVRKFLFFLDAFSVPFITS